MSIIRHSNEGLLGGQCSFFMKESNNDRRVRKTRAALYEALIHLLADRQLREVSIRELTELADVNRSTFYLHYKDIYDLFAHMEQEVLARFNELMCTEAKNGGLPISQVIEGAFDFIVENSPLVLTILQHGDRAFLEKIFRVCYGRSREDWISRHGTEDLAMHDYSYAFITSGFVGLIRAWFESGMQEPPETMRAISEQLIGRCMGL